MKFRVTLQSAHGGPPEPAVVHARNHFGAMLTARELYPPPEWRIVRVQVDDGEW